MTRRRETPQGEGDCFEVALNELLRLHYQGDESAVLVHALVVGQGPIEGIVHDHAWIERVEVLPPPPDWPDHFPEPTVRLAVDRSQGKDLTLPAALYRMIGRVHDVKEYTFEEAQRQASKHRHYGPWPEENPLVRQNSDVRLRELERQWRETGDPEIGARWLTARVRAGDLDRGNLEAASCLGYPPARIAAPEVESAFVDEGEGWHRTVVTDQPVLVRLLEQRTRELSVRVALAAVREAMEGTFLRGMREDLAACIPYVLERERRFAPGLLTHIPDDYLVREARDPIAAVENWLNQQDTFADGPASGTHRVYQCLTRLIGLRNVLMNMEDELDRPPMFPCRNLQFLYLAAHNMCLAVLPVEGPPSGPLPAYRYASHAAEAVEHSLRVQFDLTGTPNDPAMRADVAGAVGREVGSWLVDPEGPSVVRSNQASDVRTRELERRVAVGDVGAWPTLIATKARAGALTDADAREAVDASHVAWKKRPYNRNRPLATAIDVALLEAGKLPTGGWEEYSRSRYWKLLEAVLGGRKAVRAWHRAMQRHPFGTHNWRWVTRKSDDPDEPDERRWTLQVLVSRLQLERSEEARRRVTSGRHGPRNLEHVMAHPLVTLDESRLKSPIYGGHAYFWSHPYKFTLRDPGQALETVTREERVESLDDVLRRRVHDLWLAAGLDFEQISPVHAWLIAKGILPDLHLSFRSVRRSRPPAAREVHKVLAKASLKIGRPALLTASRIRKASKLSREDVERGLDWLLEEGYVETLNRWRPPVHTPGPDYQLIEPGAWVPAGRYPRWAPVAEIPRGIL
jgi:hypothetical protein